MSTDTAVAIELAVASVALVVIVQFNLARMRSTLRRMENN
jgi:hypothetical protein